MALLVLDVLRAQGLLVDVLCVVWELLSWAPCNPDHSQADRELFFRRMVEPSQQVDLAIGPVALDHEHLQSTPQKT